MRNSQTCSVFIIFCGYYYYLRGFPPGGANPFYET
nr:MAG TPA: hypothetical protein [Caudoviricetes sp.]